MTRELGKAHRQEKERANRDHWSLSTTKIMKNTLVSMQRDDVAKQRSGELRHEGQEGRRVTEHEGLRLCEFDPDQRRRDRKVINQSVSGSRLVASENVKVLTASRHSLVLQHRLEEHRRWTTLMIAQRSW